MGRGRNSTASQNFASALGEQRGPSAVDAETALLWSARAQAQALPQKLQTLIDDGDYETVLRLLNASAPRNLAHHSWRTCAAYGVVNAMSANALAQYDQRANAVAVTLIAHFRLLSLARAPATSKQRLRALTLANAEIALLGAGLTQTVLSASTEIHDQLLLDVCARTLTRENDHAISALALTGKLNYKSWRFCLRQWLPAYDGDGSANQGWGALYEAATKELARTG
jgi:hypothetical protein